VSPRVCYLSLSHSLTLVPCSATYFYQNGVAGACGRVHGDYDLICALGTSAVSRLRDSYLIAVLTDARRYGDTGVRSSLCGRSVRITNDQNGRWVDVYVADACPTCSNANSIDLSAGAFQRIADLEQGVVPSASIPLAFLRPSRLIRGVSAVSWQFNN
jgi:hypothetical protein